MSLDDALAALLELVGERVDVAIESPAGGLVAHFEGELAHGHDVTPSADDTAARIFFSFGDGGSGCIVDPRAFAAAERSVDGELLRIGTVPASSSSSNPA
jgi:hypothetical protein